MYVSWYRCIYGSMHVHAICKYVCTCRGQGKAKTSATADDLEIRVPVGTVVRDEKTGILLGDMNTPGQRLCVARGGRGGRGNWELRSAN